MELIMDPYAPEKMLTFKAAAALLNLPYYKIQRAARLGQIPTYRLMNSRPLVKLSDIEIAIQASKSGGVP